MHSSLMQWSRGVFLAGIVLALVAIVPIAWVPFTLLKVSLFALCTLVAAVLFVAGGGVQELARAHGFKGAFLVALVPLAYLVSLFFAANHAGAMTGFSIEVDTVVFTTLAAVAFMLGFAHFRTLRTSGQLLRVLFWAIVAATVFQIVSILFGQAALPLAAFADRSVNLVGKWNDLGLLIGVLAVMSLARVELGELKQTTRYVLVALSAVLIVLLALINFALAWGLLLGASLIMGVVSFLGARRIPWIPLVVAIMSVAGLIWGSTINLNITKVLPVSSLEVRPSWGSTLQVINAAQAGSVRNMLFGTGPNTFGDAWLAHKPAEVNQSQFWNLDFNVGYSTLLTAYGTVGLLGAIAWLVPVLLVLLALLRALRYSLITREDRSTVVALVLAALFAYAAIVLYVPSANIVLLAMLLSGAAFGFLWRQGQHAHEPARTMQLVALVIVLMLVAASAWAAVASTRRAIAETFVGHGTVALSNGAVDDAHADALTAQKVETTGDTLRFLVAADASKLNALAQDQKTPQAQVQQQFAATLQETIAAAQQARTLNPTDYRPTLALAQIYDLLNSLKVPGALAQAQAAYDAAATQNPTNPQIPLLRARLEATAGNGSAVQTQLKQALTLKPNYTDAMLFIAQLAVANNDLNTAVQASQAAVQTAPGVPSLWFELGLLLYTGRDVNDAVVALEQAVKLEPDYANAKYFLGLSYAAQSKNQDAIAQFQDLEKSNPDNAEVKSILSNLQAGKQPFAGEATTPPQDRSTAPLQ